MIRLALVAAIFLAIVGGIVFASRGFLLNKSATAVPEVQPQEVPLSTESGQLTNQVYDLIEQGQKPLQAETPSNNTQVAELTARVRTLETAVLDLRAQIRALQSSGTDATTTTTATSTTAAKPPIYIPLNFNGQVTSQTYSVLPNQTLTINPGDYPGYSSMVLIVQLQAYQGSGTAYAQLVNTTNNAAVNGSEVTTSNYQFVQLVSDSFSLPAGSQPYGIQMKNTTGYPAIIQNAMIKVNF